jgi:hypothetical protein
MLDLNAPLQFQINLDPEFFSSLDLNYDSVHDYAIEAARECSKSLGNKIALCLSGGIDSQLTVLAFREAKIDFDVYTLEFNDNLNDFDFNHAKLFCEHHKINYVPIKFNVIDFLNRCNYEIGQKYYSPSPHFNVHYGLFNILKDKNYTGIVCGGVYPHFYEGFLAGGLLQNQLNFINYSIVENIPVQGSFLSYHPKLCWSLGLLSKPVSIYINRPIGQEELDKLNHDRYLDKVELFKSIGFDVIPQNTKYTGFEKVKLYYGEKYKDGWFFEKQFRYPLDKKFTKMQYNTKVLNLTPEQEKALLSRYRYNLTSC